MNQHNSSNDPHFVQGSVAWQLTHWLFTKSVSPHRARARERESDRLSRLSQLGSVTDVTDSLCMSVGRRCLS